MLAREISVKQKLIGLGAFCLVLTCTVIGVGKLGQFWLTESLSATSTMAQALRNHMQADMMHDALRGDVLSALRAGRSKNRADLAQTEADLNEHIENFEAVLAENQKLPLNSAIRDALLQVRPALDAYREGARGLVALAGRDAAGAEARYPQFLGLFTELEEAMEKTSDLINEEVVRAEQDAQAAANLSQRLMWLALIVGVLSIGFVTQWITRGILEPLNAMRVAVDRMRDSDSNYHRLPHLAAEFGELGDALNRVIDQMALQHDVEMQVAAENRRIRNALDGASANVMIADADGQIVYMNRTVTAMLTEVESDLRRALPGFKVDELIGKNFDAFHKDPSHQRGLLKHLTGPHRARINVSGLTFDLIAGPVLGEHGERLGSVVEWRNVTEELAAEQQIAELIQKASRGDLNARIDAGQFRVGFLKSLGEGVNQMLDAVVQPLRAAKRALQALADGDLSQTVNGTYEGEFAELRDAVNECIANLENMVRQILESADSISTSSAEIAQGNQDLSQRTEQQASSLEETASTMEELTGTVRKNADSARQADQLARNTRRQAESGGAVVGSAVTAMSEINRSSNKIADIIGVIDEIAFQTNLLALNAAVGAARACEQGRGFAVVASEVRNLAQRSAGAAKEIKALIKDSVEKVDEGSRLVNESGSTLQAIVDSVKRVSDIIAEIAEASDEQSAGVEQVNRAITNMDQAVQQNAALVEQAAAASLSMDDQSRNLARLMAFFRNSDQAGKVRVAKAPAQGSAKPRRRAA